ncbi:MAG: hypothetical protein JWN79_1017 [Gemmatimonadetes bacterium]|jgi:DNA-binding transcriptional regulator GbsR (MarR family)|nr:hypothetical protein [Gemmatimonadota bacterium]
MADTDSWFIEQLGIGAEADGFSRIAGRLFGALLLSAEPRSLDSLVAELGVSKASISIEARRLVERSVAQRVGVVGDRRDYYQLVPHFYSGLMRARVERWKAMRLLMARLQAEDSTRDPVVRERLAEISTVHDLVAMRIEEALCELEQYAADADAAQFRRS